MSSIIQIFAGPIFGKNVSRATSRTESSDQLPFQMKCNRESCCACVRSGTVVAAIGSILLRSSGRIRPSKQSRSERARSAWPMSPQYGNPPAVARNRQLSSLTKTCNSKKAPVPLLSAKSGDALKQNRAAAQRERHPRAHSGQ